MYIELPCHTKTPFHNRCRWEVCRGHQTAITTSFVSQTNPTTPLTTGQTVLQSDVPQGFIKPTGRVVPHPKLEGIHHRWSTPTPILRPRIGFFKVEPAMSQFRVVTALRPSVPDAVTECSPSPKGRPVGPRAQRSNGISSLAFISCLLHIQIPLRVSRCPAPNVSSRCCSSQNISPTPGAMRARRRNLLGTRSRTSPSTTAAQ